MKRSLAALAAALTVAALLLTACSGDGSATHGRVTSKDHEPAHTAWRTQKKTRQSCTTTTKRSGSKTRTVRKCRSVPASSRRVAHRTAECWELHLDTGDELCVSATKWLKTRVGDRI